MKKSKVIPFGLSLVLTVSFLYSCSQENEKVSPQAPAEEDKVVLTIGDAVAADSPTLGELEEETSNLPFPQQSSPNGRTAYGGVTDFVDFNDEMALSIIPEQARNVFTNWPFYIQQVGNAWIHVRENNIGNYNPNFMSYEGHYHLSYQNFIPCVRLDQGGDLGKPYGSGNGCISINPTQEPRTLDTHDGNQWIKIYAYDYDSPSRVFDLLGIKVTNGPIQIWYRKASGKWYYWRSVGEGTWNLSAKSTGVTQVLISSATGGTVGFDNVKVHVPLY